MTVTPNSVVTPQLPRNAAVQIANTDGTNLKALVVGAASGTKVSAIGACNTDTAAYTLQLVRNIGGSNSGGTVTGGTNYPLASVALAASAGNVAGTPPVGVMTTATIPGIAVDSTGSPYLYVNAGEFLCVALTSAVSAGKFVSAQATAADF